VVPALGDDHVHVEALGDAGEDVGVVGLNQSNHVGALGFNHLRQWISPAFAAVEDVVGEDAQADRLSAELFGRGPRK
jgi:hypothetical protein